MNLNDYFDKLINDFKYDTEINRKKEIYDMIETFYNNFDKDEFYHKNVYKKLRSTYKTFMRNYREDISFLISNESKSENYDYDKIYKNASEDIYFIKFILKNIKFKKEYTINSDYRGTKKELDNYIMKSDKLSAFMRKSNIDLIIDDNLLYSSILCSNSKSFIVLNDNNISSYLHELMHDYNDLNDYKFQELAPILAELGIVQEYDLYTSFTRMKEIKDFKNQCWKNKVNDNNYETYVYGIASMVALSFLYVHGNNIKDIIEVTDFTLKNNFISLVDLFTKLNIKDIEIVDSLNNVDKILNLKK